MILRGLWPFKFPQQHQLLLSLHPPTKSHTNFKSLITPDLGCFLVASQVRKSPSLSLLYVSCRGGVKRDGTVVSFWGGRLKLNSQSGRLGVKVRNYKGRVPQAPLAGEGGQEKGGATCGSSSRWGVKIDAVPAVNLHLSMGLSLCSACVPCDSVPPVSSWPGGRKDAGGGICGPPEALRFRSPDTLLFRK